MPSCQTCGHCDATTSPFLLKSFRQCLMNTICETLTKAFDLKLVVAWDIDATSENERRSLNYHNSTATTSNTTAITSFCGHHNTPRATIHLSAVSAIDGCVGAALADSRNAPKPIVRPSIRFVASTPPSPRFGTRHCPISPNIPLPHLLPSPSLILGTPSHQHPLHCPVNHVWHRPCTGSSPPHSLGPSRHRQHKTSPIASPSSPSHLLSIKSPLLCQKHPYYLFQFARGMSEASNWQILLRVDRPD